jgi:hypothetical protein
MFILPFVPILTVSLQFEVLLKSSVLEAAAFFVGTTTHFLGLENLKILLNYFLAITFY